MTNPQVILPITVLPHFTTKQYKTIYSPQTLTNYQGVLEILKGAFFVSE